MGVLVHHDNGHVTLVFIQVVCQGLLLSREGRAVVPVCVFLWGCVCADLSQETNKFISTLLFHIRGKILREREK